MKTSLIYIIFSCFVFFINKTYGQQNEKIFIIWDINGNYKYHDKYDSLTIDSLLSSTRFENDSALLIYEGNAIENPREYKLYANAIRCRILPNYSVVHLVNDSVFMVESKSLYYELNLDDFFPENDTLFSFDTLRMDYCVKLKDSLADGKWKRYIRKNNVFFLSEQKSILNNLIHGAQIYFYSSGKIKGITYANYGYEITRNHYNEDGLLIGLDSLHCNVLVRTYSYHIIQGQKRVLRSYYDYNLGLDIGFHDNGQLSKLQYLYKGVPHGLCVFYDNNGNVLNKGFLHYGKVIE
jgi:hypothetical protein